MRWLVVLLLLLAAPGWCGEAALSSGQLLYVPVYSHIYTGDKERPFNLAVTVSIRNTDPRHSLKLSAVDYYDTKGALVRHYLDSPQTLGPLASERFVIAEKDTEGGSGANFLVRWQSDAPINPPVVESVMIGAQSGQGISFTSRARVLAE